MTVKTLRHLFAPIMAIALLVGCGQSKPPVINSWTAAATGNIKALKQHFERIKAARPKVAALLHQHGGKGGKE